MSIHQYVVDNLEARKGKWRQIAAASGVGYSTLKKIATRDTRRPRIDSLEKLAQYFLAQPPGPRAS